MVLPNSNFLAGIRLAGAQGGGISRMAAFQVRADGAFCFGLLIGRCHPNKVVALSHQYRTGMTRAGCKCIHSPNWPFTVAP